MTEAPTPVATPAASETPIWALIPCAGSGQRAAADGPKQYRSVAGQALVLHTLDAFIQVPRIRRTLVIVAVGDRFFDQFERAPQRAWSSVACGGPTRARTVSNALDALRAYGAQDHDWVLVHDAARCLVSADLINRLIDACLTDAVGGLLAQSVSDTLKVALDGRVGGTSDRSRYWLAQTPQMFRLGTLRHALARAGDAVTDESSAIEMLGLAPKLVPGSGSNFKVTFPEDFALAQAVLLSRRRLPDKDLRYDYP